MQDAGEGGRGGWRRLASLACVAGPLCLPAWESGSQKGQSSLPAGAVGSERCWGDLLSPEREGKVAGTWRPGSRG